MKRYSTITLLALILTLSSVTAAQTSNPAGQGIERMVVDVPIGEFPMPKLNAVKDFVLKHWNDSSPAYAEITIRSKEGDPTTYKVNIDLDEMAERRLRMEIITIRYDRHLINDPNRTGEMTKTTRSYEAYEIERMKRKESSSKTFENDYFLRLKNNEGNIVFDW